MILGQVFRTALSKKCGKIFNNFTRGRLLRLALYASYYFQHGERRPVKSTPYTALLRAAVSVEEATSKCAARGSPRVRTNKIIGTRLHSQYITRGRLKRFVN